LLIWWLVTQLGKIGVPLTVKDSIIILAYIPVSGVITTVIFCKVYHHTTSHHAAPESCALHPDIALAHSTLAQRGNIQTAHLRALPSNMPSV